jgi:hypothetical protein
MITLVLNEAEAERLATFIGRTCLEQMQDPKEAVMLSEIYRTLKAKLNQED